VYLIENQIRKAAKMNNTDYNTVVENIQVSKEINVIHNKNMDEEEDSRVVLTVDNEGKAIIIRIIHFSSFSYLIFYFFMLPICYQPSQ
jgi:hypothetical protein